MAGDLYLTRFSCFWPFLKRQSHRLFWCLMAWTCQHARLVRVCSWRPSAFDLLIAADAFSDHSCPTMHFVDEFHRGDRDCLAPQALTQDAQHPKLRAFHRDRRTVDTCKFFDQS